MSKGQMLRILVQERLTAAAEEIFALFERTIAEYEEEMRRSAEENRRNRALLESALSPRVVLLRKIPATSPSSGLNPCLNPGQIVQMKTPAKSTIPSSNLGLNPDLNPGLNPGPSIEPVQMKTPATSPIPDLNPDLNLGLNPGPTIETVQMKTPATSPIPGLNPDLNPGPTIKPVQMKTPATGPIPSLNPGLNLDLNFDLNPKLDPDLNPGPKIIAVQMKTPATSPIPGLNPGLNPDLNPGLKIETVQMKTPATSPIPGLNPDLNLGHKIDPVQIKVEPEEAHLEPIVAPTSNYQLHTYQVPLNTAGQANTTFKQILPSSAPTPAAPFVQLPCLQPKPAQPVRVGHILLMPSGASLAHAPTYTPQTPRYTPQTPRYTPQTPAHSPAEKTKRKYTRTVTSNACRKCGKFRTVETGHSQYKGKIFCPNTERVPKETWLQRMRILD